MTSSDRAPDEPPELSASAPGAPLAPLAPTSPPHSAAPHDSALQITGVSPLTPSTSLPSLKTSKLSTTSATGLVVVTDAATPESDSASSVHPFSVSPAHITPPDSVTPVTPGTALTGTTNPSGSTSSPLGRKRADDPPHSAVEPSPSGIPFPDDDSLRQHFEGPSSAPPTPSVISVTHPSAFIHTHHPRRGSLTPLGLNVISPVPPPQTHSLDNGQAFPIRSVGFNAPGDAQSEASRRDSVASTASNLTATRPSTYSMNAIAGSSSAAMYGASRRRSSLTPSLPNSLSTSNLNTSKRRGSITPFLPTLAAPSPTRAVVAGRLSARPPSSEGTYLPTQSRTMDSIVIGRRASAAAALFGGDARRGSLPHLYYGAWTRGPGTPSRESWNPTLASQRGSVDDTAMINKTFKFGCPPAASAPSSSTGSRTESGDDTASGSLHRLAQLGSARQKDMSAFELAEQQEADRQRRAFLAATYGEDSRRARARLSLGGPSGASPGSPASTRRQSLLLWERINKPPEAVSGLHPAAVSAAALAAVAAATVLSPPLLHQTLENELGRRPSLPINIPMRTPPVQTSESFDDQSIWDNPDGIDPNQTPVRPLPPLLPLSDPVPRLLPSTLALHRATHLLNARGISSEPLPAPLPPSLHPPAPVDLSEFDIDFILAGSRSNLGRQGSTSSSVRQFGVDSILRNNGPGVSGIGVGGIGGPGGEEEDSFAKFVGAFDDEYGGRRGDWTFRACGSSSSSLFEPPSPMDDSVPLPLPADPSRPRPRTEWESPGAGRFEIYPNGDVRSVESGAVWRIHKSGAREYEFEQPLRMPASLLPPPPPPSENAPQPLVFAACGGYMLASKLVHTENGGVKLPFSVQRQLKAKGSRVSRRFAAAKHRQSLTAPEVEPEPRSKRIGSEDSGATAIPITNQSNRLSTPALASSVPPRAPTTSPTSPIDDIHGSHHHHSSTPRDQKRLSRGRKEREKESDDDKHKKTFGGVLKRGLFRAQSLVKEYEERNKDRHLFTNGQNHWHGSNHGGTSYSGGYSSGATRHSPARPSPTERPLDPSDTASASSQHSSKYANDSPDDLADWPEDAPFGSLGLGIEDEQNGGQPWKEGRAWSVVPEEALAMVIPIESDARTPPLPHTPTTPQPFINPFFVDGPRQALLVWFTPFNANTAPEVPSPLSPLQNMRAASTWTLSRITEAPHHEEASAHGSSLRLPKLLRPRGQRPDGSMASPLASSKTIPIPPPTTTPPSDFELQPNGSTNSRRQSRNFQPLPFKSFRVVAKVVNTEDLRSEPEVPVIALEQWTEQLRTGKPASGLHTPPLEAQARMDDGSSSSSGLTPLFSGDTASSLGDSSVTSGRAFPTVIAVCHSQASGVEFVLEGLDRLGLCKGGNAWGPTGYEEWRGTGLSENGRQAIDLLWTACTAVMGV